MSDYQKYTDEEIYEMLLPKLLKNGAIRDNNGNVVVKLVDIRKAIATAYRSGYARCEKGRSFIIGEKKIEFQFEPKWVIVDREPKIGDMVMMKDNRLNQHEPDFYPVSGVVGKVSNKIGVCGNCEVQWPKGTTSGDDKWWVSSNHLGVAVWK